MGIDGLAYQSKRPKNSPKIKLTTEIETRILDLRQKRNLGVRRIQTELIRLYDIRLSIASVHKVLIKHQVKPIIKRLKRKKAFKRYQRPIPRDRVQLDTCKITPVIYQYTAVTAANTLKFLDKIMEEFPFPIQRIQTKIGVENFLLKISTKDDGILYKISPIKTSITAFKW